MTYKYIISLILICLFSFGNSQELTKEINSKTENKIKNTSNIKEWDIEDKNINNPWLQKLLDELKNEFATEQEILVKEFKQKVSDLKNLYSAKREKLKNKFKNDTIKKIRPNSSKNQEKSKLIIKETEKPKPLKKTKTEQEKQEFPTKKQLIKNANKKPIKKEKVKQ